MVAVGMLPPDPSARARRPLGPAPFPADGAPARAPVPVPAATRLPAARLRSRHVGPRVFDRTGPRRLGPGLLEQSYHGAIPARLGERERRLPVAIRELDARARFDERL